jgi:hypothetical protein
MPSNESELPRVYCVARNHPEVEAENVCTNVMKYAGCGSMVDGEWHSSSLRCNEHPVECAGCASEAPYNEFRRLAAVSTAGMQGECMMASRYECEFVFQRGMSVAWEWRSRRYFQNSTTGDHQHSAVTTEKFSIHTDDEYDWILVGVFGLSVAVIIIGARVVASLSTISAAPTS